MNRFTFLPIQGAYIIMFFLAAQSKFMAGGVPGWFTEKFRDTFLGFSSGMLAFQFYSIAILEAFAFLGFFFSLLRGEFLPKRKRPILQASLLLSCFIFMILGFGLRLTNDFETASQVFAYLVFSWILLIALRADFKLSFK